MKRLLFGVILLCLAGVMACEDSVIGEYPITRIDDVVMVFPLPGDDYRVNLKDDYCSVSVNRPHDEQSTLNFYEYYDGEILSVLIVKQP